MPRNLRTPLDQPASVQDQAEGGRTYRPWTKSAYASGPSVFLGAFNKSIADELQLKLQAPVSMGPIFNEQQEAIFAWGKNESGSLNVVARAGTGKTTVVIELARRISPTAQASTMHSIGYRLWRKIRQQSEVDSNKVRGMAYLKYPFDRAKPQNKDAAQVLIRAVSMAKQSAFGLNRYPKTDDEQAWADLLAAYDLDVDIPDAIGADRVIEDCIEVYQSSLDLAVNRGIIDYDDMILCPLYYGNQPAAMFDWVMIDEAQDQSEIRRVLAKWILKPGGRMVAVGDPAQAIYSWAGATCRAMDLIKREMGAKELPLSVTYRCPQLVVKLAQQWVPEYSAHPSAPLGVVREIQHTQFWLEQFDHRRDVILCRNTRPLVGVAQRLREAGTPCTVEGQSAKGLIKLATKWGAQTDVSELIGNIQQHFTEEEARLTADGKLYKIEKLADRCGIVLDIARRLGGAAPVEAVPSETVEPNDTSGVGVGKGVGEVLRRATVADVVRALEQLFGEGEHREQTLTLSSIHRFKGKEKDRVFLLGRARYMPSKWAKGKDQLEQEKNLAYVACTRAKSELVEVVVPGARKGEVDWWEL